MKLSTLYEARDPKREAQLEPYLTAPFRNQPERAKIGRAKAKQYRQEYGMPDVQFLPSAPKGNEGPGYRWDTGTIHHGPWFRDIGTAKNVPVQRWGTGEIKPEPNVADVGKHLTQAIHYWSKNFNGERWPALEQAFLNRDFTFQGKLGMYDSARASLFKYLNELKTPWPEGEKMADRTLNSPNGWKILTSNYNHIKAAQDYVLRKPRNPEWVKRMREALGEEGEGFEGQFHADDVFERQAHYQPETLAFFRRYLSTPDDEATAFKKRMKELEERPPFAGWA